MDPPWGPSDAEATYERDDEELHADDDDQRRQIEAHAAHAHTWHDAPDGPEHRFGDRVDEAVHLRHDAARLQWEPAQDDAYEDDVQVVLQKRRYGVGAQRSRRPLGAV